MSSRGDALRLFARLPRGSWLARFLDYSVESESPAIFRFWAGVAAVGASQRRRTWIDRGAYLLAPAHYILLVAPSGTCRKSQAINLAGGLLRAAGVTRMLPRRTTPEMLLKQMKKRFPITWSTADETVNEVEVDAVGCIFVSELATLVGRERWMEHMTVLLTELGDAPADWDGGTIARGVYRLKNVALTVVAGCTPAWLARAVAQSAHEGGALARFVALYRDKPEPAVSRPHADAAVAVELVDDLRRLSLAFGAFVEGRQARVWFDRWYCRHKASRPRDIDLLPFWERKHDHLLRLAAMLALSRGGGTMIEPDDMALAADVLELTAEGYGNIMAEIGKTPFGLDIDLVRARLAAMHSAAYPDLLRSVQRRMGARQFEEVMRTLEATGEARVLVGHGSNGEIQTRIWQWTGGQPIAASAFAHVHDEDDGVGAAQTEA